MEPKEPISTKNDSKSKHKELERRGNERVKKLENELKIYKESNQSLKEKITKLKDSVSSLEIEKYERIDQINQAQYNTSLKVSV